ncbi:telomere-associated protein RIF1 isoform X2 [Fundulus heteroclitus]|uniref:telomere-associated protein RIF1 isoform X2 n=1 Tax=Fundulus heteroclitus TaxID=8078 RepID=UPI00165CDC27|nr:telomere-associated protein RIF1 isoform X2 [Fundulus heteroclitus]
MMATAGPPSTSSFLPLLETLEDSTAGQSEQTDAYLTIANRLSGDEGRQFLPAVQNDFSRLGKVILAHASNSNADLSQAALQALGFCVFHSQVVSGISENLAAQILSALCSLVTKSTDKNTCTRALWVISKQSFPADVVGKNVPTLLGTLESVWNREDIQSTVMEHEALNVIIRMVEQVPTEMCDGAVRWAKLVIPLVVHSASKVRLRAAAALEMGMPLLLAKQTEVAAVIEPMMSTKLIPELQKLFMSKNETNVLKLWPLFVKLLGKLLHKGGPFINSLLHLEELGFRSSSPTIKKIAFIAWKSLIDNFALNPDILCSSKRMKLLMQPLTSIHVRTEALLLAKVEVWWYLIVQLGPNLSSNFEQVAVPLLQSTIGSDSSPVANTPRTVTPNGAVTPGTPKSGNVSFNLSVGTPRTGLNSSVQVPSSFSSIQLLGLEMLLHYFLGPEVVAAAAKNKLVLNLEPLNHPLLSGASSFLKHAAVLVSNIRDGFTNIGKDAPELLLAVIWTSLVRFVNLTIESGTKKERQGSEVLTMVLQALQSIVVSEALPADRVLILLEATVKGLPQRVLGSASYQVGKMDVLNGTPALYVILLLFNSCKLPSYVEDERFFHCLQTLVSCGLSGPTSPLAFAEAVLGAMSSCAGSLQNKEQLWRMWSLMVGPLTDTITQSNEVNQGDALEHNFSAMHSALMFPITHHLHGTLLQQASQKSMLSSWSKLYRVFARCSALVVTAEENICCEELCVKMAAAVDGEALRVPSTLNTVSSFLHVMVECVDFSPYTPHFQQKLKSPHTPVNWTRKRSKALGNLSTFVSLLVQCLQVYLEAPEASSEAAGSALVSIMSTLFTNLVLANAITEALSALIQPLALFYKHDASETSKFSTHLQGKLEKLLCEVVSCLQSRSTLAYNDDLLALLSPLLCEAFPHKSKHVRTAVTQFWNATFANTVSLTYPEEIRPVLNQVKQKTPIILPGFEAVSVPDELSETYSSESSQLETKLSGITVCSTGKRDSMLSKPELKDRSATKTSKPVSTKLDFGSPKPPRRGVLEEEASIDFVFIPPETKERVLTEHQKEVKRTKRVDIPAMYNNLDASLDTTVFSQYTQSQDDSLDNVAAAQGDGIATEAPNETEKPTKVAEILSKESQESPKDQPEESLPHSSDVSLEEPTKSTDRTRDMDIESKESPSPNTSASSDLVSGTPQKPSSRRQSFITLEKYGEGKPASPSSASSFTGPLVKPSTTQDPSSADKLSSCETSQTSVDPNHEGSSSLRTVGQQCPGDESPKRPKESRTKSEPVRLIERLQNDSAEDEEAIPDTQMKEDIESSSYTEESQSLSQIGEPEPVLDDSQSSSDEPRRSRRHRVRPQLPGEDPEEREAKYTHVKRRRSEEEPKVDSSNSAQSRPNTRSKEGTGENSGRDRLRSKSQSNSAESSQSTPRGRPKKKVKLYSSSENLLESPGRKRRSTSELQSRHPDIQSETQSNNENQKHRRSSQLSKASKEAGEAEGSKEGSSQISTDGMVDLIKKDDAHPNTDSQRVIPLVQTEKSEEVKPEEMTQLDESLKEVQKVLTSSPESEAKSQESLESNAVMPSPVEESKDETRKKLESVETTPDNINAIETVVDNSSQKDLQATPSSSDMQGKRRYTRRKATSEAAGSEDKDGPISSPGPSRRSQTSALVSQAETGIGGRTRRSKLVESSPSFTPESSQSLDISRSGSSQGRGRPSRLRSSQSLSQSLSPSVDSSESESSMVLEDPIRKRRGRKPRASLQSPLTLQSKDDSLDMKETVSQNLETKNSSEESSEIPKDLKEVDPVTRSKTEPNKDESESPVVTESQAESEDLKKTESEDAHQESKSMSSPEQTDSNSKKPSSQEMLESVGFENTPTQDSCPPPEDKFQVSETSEEKAEKVSDPEHEVTEVQLESNSDQQEPAAPPEEEPAAEELQQSQMECAQITDEEELSATHLVSESSDKEDIPLQHNEDCHPETTEDEYKASPGTEPLDSAGPDCSPAGSAQAGPQDSPVKQKDLDTVTESVDGQSPSNGRMRGTWSPSASPSTSILKKGQKRPLEVEMTSPLVKSRRVSFANPIQQQEIADDIDRRSPALRTSSPSRSKIGSIPQPKVTTPTKGLKILSPRNLHSPGYRSSKKCLMSEMTQEPRAVPRDCIYPSLVGCSAPVEAVLSQISSTMWSRGFGQLIRARNVKSVGDLCALTPAEIKTLPIRSPKISNVKKALKIYEQQRRGRGDELKSFDETERITSEMEETGGPHNHEEEEKTSAETLATELVEEVFCPDGNSSATPTPERQDGEQRLLEVLHPDADLPSAVEALTCRMTPPGLSRCSAQQLVEMHEQLGDMMRVVVVELQTRLCQAGDTR